MARSKNFIVKVNVVKALKDLANVSYYHKRQLIEDGYLEPVKNFEAKKEGRGRAPHAYNISRKGANLVRLSANWAAFRPQAETPPETTENLIAA